jgi:cytochrome b6-f complex iron-sulfur subunit
MTTPTQRKDVPGAGAEPRPSDRRNFIGRLWAGLGLLALVELVGVGVAFFRRGGTDARESSEKAAVGCGAVDQYAPGTVTAFMRGRFYLARLEDGGFLAISRQCTHLGCTVPWDADAQCFSCPCHASRFDITGAVVNAPAPRALDLFPLSIENDTIRVSPQTPIRRGGFEKSQVVYPKAR